MSRKECAPFARDFLSPWRYGDLGTADRGDSAVVDGDGLSLGNGLTVEHTDVANDVRGIGGLRWKKQCFGNEQKDDQYAYGHTR